MKNLKTALLFVSVLVKFNAMAQVAVPLSIESREKFIQKATQLRTAENYFGAIQQLDSILANNPADAPVLLFKGDLQLQSKIFEAAAATYTQLLPLNYEGTITKINLSYALFMDHKPGKALQYAKNAWSGDKSNTNAIVNYFNAQLWNIKTGPAADFLAQQQALLSPAQVLVLKARLYTTSGNYTKGLQYYDSLVTAYPDKYYIQEYAEVLLGKKEMKQSAAAINKTEKYFSANELSAFAQKSKGAQQQNAGTGFTYFKDIAKNTRLESSAWWQQRDGRRYRFALRAGVSSVTSAQNEKTNAQFAQVTVNERWSMALSGQTDLHLQLVQPSGNMDFTSITGKQTIQYQPNDRRMIGLFINTDILNYTASLLEKNIRSNSIGYVTHIMLGGKNGFYSQGSFGALTDKNSSAQVFGSLYHLFRTEPTFKAGLNFSTVHYKDSSIKTYFSPNRYMSTEVFADYSTALPTLSKFYLQVQAAAGMQKIEQQNWQAALRLQTELGLRLAHFETALKYQTSNVASAAGTGYSYNSFTLRLMWKW